ncbi:MAG TPA: hypothetical protein VGI00_13480 [Streptosporangiaceae bacterium]|jgi:hypothetical protein
MADKRKNDRRSAITTGDITGTGIVVGHSSSSYVSRDETLSPVHREVVAKLEEFIRLLDFNEALAEDPDEVRDLVNDAKEEAEKASPRWHVVRSLLKGTAASLTAGSALTQIIANIEKLIQHLH